MDEVVSGGLAGITQTLVGHPLDTVKVCLANKTSIMWKNLYRGSLSPLTGAFLVNAQTFYTYNYFLQKYGIFTSGALTGLGISLIESPTELIKIRMQTGIKTYKQTIKEIGISKIYHGFTATALRNSLALGLYFISYEHSKICFQNEYIGSLFGGAVAGLICWTIPYPIDCIKSQIQADTTYKLKIRDFRPSMALYRGFLPCVIRSVIVNPFIFLTYEISKKQLFNQV